MATTGHAEWDSEAGFWTVLDEYENRWDVVTTAPEAMLLQRQDSQRWYGAVWSRTAGNVGEIYPCQEGDVRDGFDCNDRYTFSEARGWTGEQE